MPRDSDERRGDAHRHSRLPFAVTCTCRGRGTCAKGGRLVVGAFLRERRRARDPEPAQLVGRVDDHERHRGSARGSAAWPRPRRVTDTPSSSTSTHSGVDAASRRDEVSSRCRCTGSRGTPLRRRELLHEMATIRSIAPRARSAISSGTVTSDFQSRRRVAQLRERDHLHVAADRLLDTASKRFSGASLSADG